MQSCLVLLAQLCVFDPSNLLLEAETSWQLSGALTYWGVDRPYTGAIGRAAIVIDVPIHPHFQFRYGVEHRSYLEDSGDRGEERAFIGFEWRPFSGRK